MSESRRHVVVAGAGVAGLETALALQALASEHVSVELIAPETEYVYRPLAVAEPFRVGEMRRFPLGQLVAAAGAELRRGALVAVDPEEKRVALTDASSVEYDVLVLALGAVPLPAVPGALTFRGLPEDSEELARLLERATTRDLGPLAFAVPAGATWPLPLYELALLTGEYLSEHLTHAEVTLVTPEERPLALFGERASEGIAQLLEMRGIVLRTGETAVAFEDGALQLADGGTFTADAVVSATSARGAPPRGDPPGRARLRPDRRLRPRCRPHRRVRSGRPHAVSDQAGRGRSPGGGRRRRGDRGGCRSTRPAEPVPSRPARTAPHRLRASISSATRRTARR